MRGLLLGVASCMYVGLCNTHGPRCLTFWIKNNFFRQFIIFKLVLATSGHCLDITSGVESDVKSKQTY